MSVRHKCREIARELKVYQLAKQCLTTSWGVVSVYKDTPRDILIYKDDKVLRISHRGVRVFEQEGSDIKTFHNGTWVEDLRKIAHERYEAAHFSC